MSGARTTALAFCIISLAGCNGNDNREPQDLQEAMRSTPALNCIVYYSEVDGQVSDDLHLLRVKLYTDLGLKRDVDTYRDDTGKCQLPLADVPGRKVALFWTRGYSVEYTLAFEYEKVGSSVEVFACVLLQEEFDPPGRAWDAYGTSTIVSDSGGVFRGKIQLKNRCVWGGSDRAIRFVAENGAFQ